MKYTKRNPLLLEDDRWKTKGHAHKVAPSLPKVCSSCKGTGVNNNNKECSVCDGSGENYE